MHRNAPRRKRFFRFYFEKNAAKKSVTQEQAIRTVCIFFGFAQVRKCRRHAGGIVVR